MGVQVPNFFEQVFYNNAKSRFSLLFLDCVLEPPRLVRHTWWCPYFSLVPEATEWESQGSKTKTRELMREQKRNVFPPHKGSLIWPPGKSIVFSAVWLPNIGLLETSLCNCDGNCIWAPYNLVVIGQRVLASLSGGGLGMYGKAIFCGDYVYSGHTMILVTGQVTYSNIFC